LDVSVLPRTAPISERFGGQWAERPFPLPYDRPRRRTRREELRDKGSPPPRSRHMPSYELAPCPLPRNNTSRCSSCDMTSSTSCEISAKHGRRQNKEADADRRQSRSSHCKCAALRKDFCTHVGPLRLSMWITEKTNGMVPMRQGHDFAWWQVILLLHPASENRMIRKRERYLPLEKRHVQSSPESRRLMLPSHSA
jgi:hypothetical protein